MPEFRPTLDLDLVWMAGRQRKPVDPELFALLEAIKMTGKLTAATEQVGMPYRQAWGLITAWSDRMGQPLVSKEQGRGTQLTALGERLLSLRERINARLAPHIESAVSEVEQQLNQILNEPQSALCTYASHDLVLAELRDHLRARPGTKLDVRFVGSLDSVVALCKARCEIAGFHVPEGPLRRDVMQAYERWLKPRVQRVIHFVRRRQGLIVRAGNPLRISDLRDVARLKARFINRQRGSGTHLAFDRLLQAQGIDRTEINGYYSEEFTHLAVAAAIAGGVADVGLGIEAAARRLKMDFIPLFSEDYYLLAKKETIEREDVAEIVSVLKTDSFRRIVQAFPGYDASLSGVVAPLSDVI
ncbi:MAG TPA: substrate-binding domain-containing protein [Xanthobacteraceae bacterium]|jgi:molybdate transport repressor ModE-like protein|nr:substrate-binding domain-containing protein [Xanthobacteraceae bacterium]